MVVIKRNEAGRFRLLGMLACVLSVIVIYWSVTYFSASPFRQVLAVAGLIAAIVTLVFSVLLQVGFPRRSQVVLFNREGDMIIAINQLHETFKLRFLRDVLSDQCSTFSDEDRVRWKDLESEGFYPVLYVKQPRKVLIQRYCSIMFDDIFAVDLSNRWDHWDCSDTAEPTFATRESPPLRNWKGMPKDNPA